MMKIPDSVKVGPYTFAIEWAEDLRDDADRNQRLYGQIDFLGPVIRLRQGAPLPAETLLHEAIHGVDACYDIGLTEKQTKRLSMALYQFLTDNHLLRDG